MANIFEDEELISNRRKNHIFKNKKPLDHRFLPEKLVHRDVQIREIARNWVDVLDNVTPSNVTLYGKTGTGKTAASKFAREQLGGSCQCIQKLIQNKCLWQKATADCYFG